MGLVYFDERKYEVRVFHLTCTYFPFQMVVRCKDKVRANDITRSFSLMVYQGKPSKDGEGLVFVLIRALFLLFV